MKKLTRIFSTIFIFAIFLCGEVFAASVVKWNSDEGLKRLDRSEFKNDFYQLVNYYQPQINPLYCGMASGVILLNAMSDEIPSQKGGEMISPSGKVIEFHSYSQLSFLNAKTDKIKKRELIELKEKRADGKYDAGVSLRDFSRILSEGYGLRTELKYADENNSVEKFREDLKRYLVEDERFIVANFKGKLIGNKTGGHISPVVAFDEISDSVLVLDVALHKNPWYWVGVEDFYGAMNSLDGEKFRGWLVAS